MDVDNDIDQTLLQQFSCMGTTDRDELVKQMQILVGNNLNDTTASFFLDMNNWYAFPLRNKNTAIVKLILQQLFNPIQLSRL